MSKKNKKKTKTKRASPKKFTRMGASKVKSRLGIRNTRVPTTKTVTFVSTGGGGGR